MEDRPKSRAVIVLLAFLLIASSCFGAMGDIRYSQIGASNTVVGGVWNGTGILTITSSNATSTIIPISTFETNGSTAALSNALQGQINTNALNTGVTLLTNGGTAVLSSLQVSGNSTNYGALYVGSASDIWGLLTAHAGLSVVGSVIATTATNTSSSNIANVGTLDSRYMQQTNLFIATPSNDTDFTVLPGGVVPVGNQVYFADKDINSIWTISKSDSSWKIIQKTSP